eukprot:370692-Alexandrium_andersonii.AAC.1
MNSGPLLLNASCHMSDLQVGWGSLGTEDVDVDEAMDTVLATESDFAIFLRAHLAKLWQRTLRHEHGR